MVDVGIVNMAADLPVFLITVVGENLHLSVTTPCFFQGQATLWRRMARRQCEGGRVMALGRVGLPEWISRIRILNGFVMYDLL